MYDLSPPLCLMTKVILCVWDVIPVPYELPPDMKIDGLFEIPLVPWTLLTSFLDSTWIFPKFPGQPGTVYENTRNPNFNSPVEVGTVG